MKSGQQPGPTSFFKISNMGDSSDVEEAEEVLDNAAEVFLFGTLVFLVTNLPFRLSFRLAAGQ